MNAKRPGACGTEAAKEQQPTILTTHNLLLAAPPVKTSRKWRCGNEE